MVQPDRASVAIVALAGRIHSVRAGDDVERGPLPLQPVLADGIANRVKPARVVPHLEQPVLGIVDNAVVEGRRDRTDSAIHLERSLRFQDRVAVVQPGLMEGPPQVRLGNEEVVDEELPAHVDRNRRRRVHSGMAGNCRGATQGDCAEELAS